MQLQVFKLRYQLFNVNNCNLPHFTAQRHHTPLFLCKYTDMSTQLNTHVQRRTIVAAYYYASAVWLLSELSSTHRAQRADRHMPILLGLCAAQPKLGAAILLVRSASAHFAL